MHYSIGQRRLSFIAALGGLVLVVAACVPLGSSTTTTTVPVTTTVPAAIATTTVLTDDATTTAANPNPVVYGGTVVFTATVTGDDGSTPTGTIAWTVDGGPAGSAAEAGVVACADTSLVDGLATCAMTPSQYEDQTNDPPDLADWVFPIDATATFVPDGASYLGSSANDSTSKVHVGAMTPTPQDPFIVVGGQVVVSVAETDDLGRSLDTHWVCFVGCTTANTVLYDADLNPGVNTFEVTSVCPAGVDPATSFECQRPNLSITLKGVRQ